MTAALQACCPQEPDPNTTDVRAWTRIAAHGRRIMV